MRADKALAAFLSDRISRSRLLESFSAGKVTLLGKPIGKKFILNPGDTLEADLPEPPPTSIEPADIFVEILYEDEDVVVVNKPAGMTVHPGSGTGPDTLVHAMSSNAPGHRPQARQGNFRSNGSRQDRRRVLRACRAIWEARD